MRLPVPIFNKGKIYREVEIQKPKASVLADTKKSIDATGDMYTGLRTYLSGTITEIRSDDSVINDPIAIKSLIPKMPFISANFVALRSAVMMSPDDDGIEGIYECPRCREKTVCEHYSRDGIEYDTRDFISDLKVEYLETDSEEFTITLKDQIVMEDLGTKKPFMSVDSITMRFPTLEDSIQAYQKYGRSDEVRLQFAQYAEAITKIDGEEVDSKFRRAFGVKIFEEDRNVKHTTDQISKELYTYGLQNKVEKSCNNCGKVWQPYVNTSNFFASGLR